MQLAIACIGQSQFVGSGGRGDVQLAIAGIGQSQFVGSSGRGDIALSFAVLLPAQVFLSLRGVLEGPYSSTTGLMGDALRVAGIVPSGEPYTALGYTHVGGGGETVAPAVLSSTGNNAIVDWVVVEVRNAATPTTVMATRSALIQRDGDVVSVDGVSPVSFNLPSGNYKVALRHRNHLGVMTLNAVALGLSTTSVDFSLASTATYGTQARKSITGTFPVEAVWAGDVTFDGQIKYTGIGNDRDPILVAIGGVVPTNTLNGQYRREDVNMDASVKYTGLNNDRDPILVNIGGVIPTNTRIAQLP